MPFYSLIWSFIFLFLPQQQKQESFTIAFGSCSDQEMEQVLWKPILSHQPNVWVWLGDNIYADTEDMELMKKLYDKQKSHPDYQQLMQSALVYGIWDDHDYGLNDGGYEYPMRKESKKQLFEFLDVHPKNPAHNRMGAFQSYTLGGDGFNIKLILLDTRYFRDRLEKDPRSNNRYLPNNDGDVLGVGQWQWLEKELKESNADMHIIGSSIQFIAEEQGFEKWANFPRAHKRLYDLIVKIKPRRTLFISGDRHIAELSRRDLEGLPYPLYDFTSSGLTHTWNEDWEEKNRYRVGELVMKKNFGLIELVWTNDELETRLQVRGEGDSLFFEHKVEWYDFVK